MRTGPLFVGVGLFHKLLGACDPSLQQIALTFSLQVIAQQIGLGRLDGCIGLADQGALDILLVRQIGQCRARGGQVRVGLCKLGAIVGGIDLDDQVPFVDRLVVGDGNIGDITGYFRRQRGDVARGVGVVGLFVPDSTGPTVPMPGDIPGKKAGREHQQDAQRREQPAGTGCSWSRL